MRVTQLEIRNFRAFEQAGPLHLGPMNVLTGPNNGGKSSLIRTRAIRRSLPRFEPDIARDRLGDIALVPIGPRERSRAFATVHGSREPGPAPVQDPVSSSSPLPRSPSPSVPRPGGNRATCAGEEQPSPAGRVSSTFR